MSSPNVAHVPQEGGTDVDISWFLADWLADHQSHSLQQDHKLPLKRKHSGLDYPVPLSPLSSDGGMSELPLTPVAKRRRQESGLVDEDQPLVGNNETPRAFRGYKTTSESEAPSDNSSISRKSSPTKQLRRLELVDDGFAVDKLVPFDPSLPPELARLIKRIEWISHGVAILPASAKQQVDPRDEWLPYAFSEPSQDDTDSLFLPLAKAQLICHRAVQCELRMEDEASWNMEVHHHILRRACRPCGRRGLVDFMSTTTAKIAKHYCPKNAPAKMVDFCLFVDPAQDNKDGAGARQRIADLRSHQPHMTINHTDYAPLCDLPIAVSIETKRTGSDWEPAKIQMGTWQSSQLRAVASVEMSAAITAAAFGPASIRYYPGIIIQGHDWQFVATAVRDDGKKACIIHLFYFPLPTPPFFFPELFQND